MVEIMWLEQAALLAEIIGGFAMVVTLIYLAIEVRRNTAATRSATYQAQTDSTVALQAVLANDPELAALIPKANEDIDSISPGEHLQLQYFYTSHFNLWHSAFLNKQEGLLSEPAWNVWHRGMTLILGNQIACRQAWLQIAEIYDAEFQAYVNSIIESVGEGVGTNIGLGGEAEIEQPKKERSAI
jgi:hypothetical protein